MASFQNKDFLEEFEPPPKKLFSENDLLLKELAVKQQNIKISLEKELAHQKEFIKSRDIIGVTNYCVGECSPKKLVEIDARLEEIELLKSTGLSDDEIKLYFDYKKGWSVIFDKHRCHDKEILEKQVKAIIERVEKIKNNQKEVEDVQKIRHPMENIKELEGDLSNFLVASTLGTSIAQIRRKARKYANRLKRKTEIPSPVVTELGSNSKWDQKFPVEVNKIPKATKERKVYTCQKQQLYTVTDGEIKKIECAKNAKNFIIGTERMKLEDIMKLKHFMNYNRGQISNVLYIKNLPEKLSICDLKKVFDRFNKNGVLDFRIMTGKMRGQAFITFTDANEAEKALNSINGTLINGKPMVIQFGKKTTAAT